MTELNLNNIDASAEAAVRLIPPAWPLSHTVAVNPFLGQTGQPLEETASQLSRLTGARFYPGRDWFGDQIRAGKISDEDLHAALAQSGAGLTVETLKKSTESAAPKIEKIPLISDLVGDATDKDWPGIVIDRIGNWAGAYFDEGQALWVLPEKTSAWSDWRGFACHDLTPEIHGLPGFALAADRLPLDRMQFIREACAELGLTPDASGAYFHALLLTLGGWSQLARFRLWQSELAHDTPDGTGEDLLAIRLFWELRLYNQYKDLIGEAWTHSVRAFRQPACVSAETRIDAVLQLAAEFAAARRIDKTLSAAEGNLQARRPKLQAAFCIDVRSEIFRRQLEGLSPAIETLGFAGFFGLTTAHRGFASDVAEHRLPVLLAPGLASVSGTEDSRLLDDKARFRARAVRAWGRFRQAAVSSFAFVEAAGVTFAGKLVLDSLGAKTKSVKPEPKPRLHPQPDLTGQIDAAESILRAMSLTDTFAPFILLVGHGASVVNNPHHSALNCGACGGYSGEVNARLLAGLLNAPEVRSGLVRRGISIPQDTVFVAALHDTTTDHVILYADDCETSKSHPVPQTVALWLEEAGRRARQSRAGQLPGARNGNQVTRRSRDWSETRPEWGLAGCQAFIAAPRRITRACDLQASAFLHDYDWTKDKGFRVLELILTAPVVVASWISLQYYGSSVAPDIFGAGNKVLHNVVGGFGVLEGNGGVLRTGLPLQSVHDGARLVHEPVRLAVCVKAPITAINDILSRHPGVRDLFENGWLHLYQISEAGRLAQRYCGEMVWAPAPWPNPVARAAAA